MTAMVSSLNASQAAQRYHSYRASLRARRLNNRPPGVGIDPITPLNPKETQP
ncbi:hypothetical protein [Ruegeria profundi]|uniref:hypothetical protein n=1 Tax=Ruegeria profundi TaxID=1685378 RepID=UPI000AF918DE|nr:hypothetical protein [Ruegeria profundi]